MIRQRRFFIFFMIFLPVLYISSFIMVAVVTIPMKTLLNDQVADNEDHNRHKCVSNLLGIPSSLLVSECIRDSCRNVTCDKLFKGDPEAIAAALHFERNTSSDEEVHNYATDCTRLWNLDEYHMQPVRASDVDFPIAFTILLHTNAEQFERLLRAIYRPQNIYCVHVDTKSPKTFQAAVKTIVNCFRNVFLATRLHHVVYAGPSRLQADIDCMKDHLAHKVHWHYVINMAGQAYPLRTPEEMVDILRIYNGANDIEGIYKRQHRKRYTQRWEEWFENGRSGMRATEQLNPLPPHELDIVRGSAYGIFSRKFVQFVLSDQHARDLLKWSQNTFSPDEHYWATLQHTLYNPQLHTPGGYSGNADTKEFVALYAKWSSSGRSKCAGKYVRWVCILGVGDLRDLMSRREFFVNKFYTDYQPLAFECAERWLQHRVHCPVQFDAGFYRNLSFVVAHKNKLSV